MKTIKLTTKLKAYDIVNDNVHHLKYIDFENFTVLTHCKRWGNVLHPFADIRLIIGKVTAEQERK